MNLDRIITTEDKKSTGKRDDQEPFGLRGNPLVGPCRWTIKLFSLFIVPDHPMMFNKIDYSLLKVKKNF